VAQSSRNSDGMVTVQVRELYTHWLQAWVLTSFRVCVLAALVSIQCFAGWGPSVHSTGLAGSRASRSISSYAWYGPILMNTQEELQKAFHELEQGTFL